MFLEKKAEIGKKIKQRRKELNLEQSIVLDYAGISAATLSNIEQGSANFTIDKLLSILDVLGLEMDIKVKG